MQIDWNQINQGGQLDKVLSTFSYPMDKDEVIAEAQQAGANPQVVSAIKQVLPDKTYNSADEIKTSIQRASQQKH